MKKLKSLEACFKLQKALHNVLIMYLKDKDRKNRINVPNLDKESNVGNNNKTNNNNHSDKLVTTNNQLNRCNMHQLRLEHNNKLNMEMHQLELEIPSC